MIQIKSNIQRRGCRPPAARPIPAAARTADLKKTQPTWDDLTREDSDGGRVVSLAAAMLGVDRIYYGWDWVDADANAESESGLSWGTRLLGVGRRVGRHGDKNKLFLIETFAKLQF